MAVQRLFPEVSERRRYEQVAELYRVLRRFSSRSKLRYKVGPLLPLALAEGQSVEMAVVEYMVVLNDAGDTQAGDDDSDLAAGNSLSGEPEERARRFLIAHYPLFSFLPEDDPSARRKFDAQLFLKHSFRSRMGTHCIFGWRIGSVEVPASCFVVHLDQVNRLVMVSSTYQPDTDLSNIDLKPDDCKAQLATLLDTYKGSITGQPIVEPVLIVQNWRSQEYAYRLRVKLTLTNERQDGPCVWLIGPQGIERSYCGAVRAAAGPIGLARVYQGYWIPKRPAAGSRHASDGADDAQPAPAQLSDLLDRKQTEVVLLGLDSDLELSGRYVKVIDKLTLDLPQQRSFNFLGAPLKSSSEFDRQMAYYHIDLIQRFFRDLGLHVLDDYPELNPLAVVLQNDFGPLYASSEKRLYISALIERFTNAQDARILYHEFVHAVTDALARLNRHDKADALEPRRFQVLQAAAMDEGLADFFACSLAARHGAGNAFFYPPPQIDDDENLSWTGIRRLGGPAPHYAALAYDFASVKTDDLPADNDAVEAIIYAWCEQWGRYLWSLRCRLGADVAEVIIAHSIFFLTRWSTFSAGVLAIALADRLLFGGIHQPKILDVKLALDCQDDMPAVDVAAPATSKPDGEDQQRYAA